MKLETEIHDGKVRERVFISGVDAGLVLCSTRQLTHDAMAAHALLQALGEYGFPGATKMITERAESIMASWGVEQEVAG
jgi:hypothetical protein